MARAAEFGSRSRWLGPVTEVPECCRKYQQLDSNEAHQRHGDISSFACDGLAEVAVDTENQTTRQP